MGWKVGEGGEHVPVHIICLLDIDVEKVEAV